MNYILETIYNCKTFKIDRLSKKLYLVLDYGMHQSHEMAYPISEEECTKLMEDNNYVWHYLAMPYGKLNYEEFKNDLHIAYVHEDPEKQINDITQK